ncbi:MAG TPA: dephospho-CoA kinase, partial [Anaerolineae bacterium]|nr:dephospho-CoA kinase [Anaerolineae bacterium]
HEHIRKERIAKRNGRSSEDISGIFSAQLPESEKVKKADIVFANNTSIDKIRAYGLMISELPRYFDDI